MLDDVINHYDTLRNGFVKLSLNTQVTSESVMMRVLVHNCHSGFKQFVRLVNQQIATLIALNTLGVRPSSEGLI